MLKKIILKTTIILSILCGLFLLYTKWKYPHAWQFNVICNSTLIDSFIVIDSNFKSAELRADEYVKNQTKYPLNVEIEMTKAIGRTPWKKYGVIPKKQHER